MNEPNEGADIVCLYAWAVAARADLGTKLESSGLTDEEAVQYNEASEKVASLGNELRQQLKAAAMNAQREVCDAIAARGYRGDWTAEQFAARQVAKLVEELGELDACFAGCVYWEFTLEDAALRARQAFDSRGSWGDSKLNAPENAKQELADIQVVVFGLAEALAEITGEPFDVVEAARAKATADVERGVR